MYCLLFYISYIHYLEYKKSFIVNNIKNVCKLNDTIVRE
jgi:hypothetical protein